MNDLLEGVLRGSVRATARLITGVENDAAVARDAIIALYPHTGRAHIVGITGPPGCGKSTLVNEIAKQLNDRGLAIAIVAVDPSSPFTGGALLGDRVRMADLALRERIFMRSMASRGTLGGLAQTTSAVIKVLDAAGYDVILVETVGAGQAEVDIASVAHTVLVIEAPGSGDEVQSIKAGILEIADILVVNKADRPSAINTVRALEMMLHLGRSGFIPKTDAHHHHHPGQEDPYASSFELEPDKDWQVPVIQTIAVEGEGIDELIHKITDHRQHLIDTGEWYDRELRRSKREIEMLMQTILLSQLDDLEMSGLRESSAADVARRRIDPYTAAVRLFDEIKSGRD